MKKLYYDCPIEAAYMAKNFGVRLQRVNPTQLVEEDLYKEYNHPAHMANLRLFDCMEKAWQKIYVHPDSLSIFEPSIKDIGIDEANELMEYSNFAGTFWFSIDQQQGGSAAKGLVKIIKRGNKLFISPKIEEQNV